jgi:hypothetical protein
MRNLFVLMYWDSLNVLIVCDRGPGTLAHLYIDVSYILGNNDEHEVNIRTTVNKPPYFH